MHAHMQLKNIKFESYAHKQLNKIIRILKILIKNDNIRFFDQLKIKAPFKP